MSGSRRQGFRIGFALSGLGGAKRSTLHLAQPLIQPGRRADRVIPCFAGDCRTAIPRRARMYRGRLPHTDRTLLREAPQSAAGGAEGAGVKAPGGNPFVVARVGLVLDRKHPGVVLQHCNYRR